MIFYFSGTGNSLQAAKKISEESGERLISIAALMKRKSKDFVFNLKDEEAVGFVYPVYAWAPPKMVLDFIEKLSINNYKDNYTFSIATCGENVGNTMKLLEKTLKSRGLQLHSGFSIKMPNNYIIMGDVDPKDEEIKKLAEAEELLKGINSIIQQRARGHFQLVKGFMPTLLTSVISPIFTKAAITTKKFYADDSCTSCGICEKVCNTQTIKIDKKPSWGDECTQCLACIHFCPVKAIQFGKSTAGKGRYVNPKINTKEMFIEMQNEAD